jgi:predicted phage terminase large subunit-like protein
MTRWHEDDLAGWLLQQEREEEEPERWHIVNFSAIKDDAGLDFPVTCTIEPDWRSHGEALCPERFPLPKLNKIKTKIGSYFWASLYQQRPSPESGNIFDRNNWKYWTELPARSGQWVLSVDASFKDKTDSDFVAIQVWFKSEGCFYLVDQVRDRMAFTATVAAIRQMVAKHPRCAAKLIEDKANGSAIIDTLKLEIPGLIPVNPTDSKVARARAVSPFIEAGNVYIPQSAPWTGDFIEEMCSFPNGAHDDQCDAMSMALKYMQGNIDTAALLSKILN